MTTTGGGAESRGILGVLGGVWRPGGLVALSIMGIMSSEWVSGTAVEAHPPTTLRSFLNLPPLAIASAVNFYVFLKRYHAPQFSPYYVRPTILTAISDKPDKYRDNDEHSIRIYALDSSGEYLKKKKVNYFKSTRWLKYWRAYRMTKTAVLFRACSYDDELGINGSKN